MEGDKEDLTATLHCTEERNTLFSGEKNTGKAPSTPLPASLTLSQEIGDKENYCNLTEDLGRRSCVGGMGNLLSPTYSQTCGP